MEYSCAMEKPYEKELAEILALCLEETRLICQEAEQISLAE